MTLLLRSRFVDQITVSNTVLKLTGAPVNAEVSIDPTGANNTLKWRAVQPGLAGNNIKVAYVDPAAASKALSIVVTQWTAANVSGPLITVNLATNSLSAITTTAQNLIDAAKISRDLLDLVRVLASGTVTGALAAIAATALATGADATGAFLLPFRRAIFVPSTDIRVTGDSNDPAAATGFLWPANSRIEFLSSFINYRKYLENLRVIRATGTDSVLNVEYFD